MDIPVCLVPFTKGRSKDGLETETFDPRTLDASKTNHNYENIHTTKNYFDEVLLFKCVATSILNIALQRSNHNEYLQ